MSLNVAASLADIVDGPIARSTPGRHPVFAVVGSKLDCYSDIVSHFVVPASLLMHISDMNALCTALAAVYVCAGILRHVSAFPLGPTSVQLHHWCRQDFVRGGARN